MEGLAASSVTNMYQPTANTISSYYSGKNKGNSKQTKSKIKKLNTAKG